MKYSFMTMPDETEITHSSIFEENGVEKIRVYIERPVEGGFIDATCILPDYSWQNNGFSDAEIKEFQDILKKKNLYDIIKNINRLAEEENARIARIF